MVKKNADSVSIKAVFFMCVCAANYINNHIDKERQ